MKKRLIAAMIFAVTLIYLSISATALTFNSKLYYTAFKQETTSYQTWQEITGFPFTLSKIGSTSNDKYMMFCAFKTNEIILDGKIIVITITLNDILPNDIVVNGVGQLDSSTLVTNSTIYPSALKALSYDQEIIATTKKSNGNSTTITTTYRASGYQNMYPIIWYDYVARENLNTAITMANCSLYESIEEASGSGTTPEEMREVLDQWSEEQLIPGIGEEIKDSYKELINEEIGETETFMEEVGNALAEQITPYFENTDQIRDAIHGGATGVFGYAGTDAVITLPAARNPFTGNSLMWNEYQIDLGMYYLRLPAVLRQLISALLTMLVSIGVLREMLDTVNTILIHREMLGMPDEHLKSWTRKDG